MIKRYYFVLLVVVVLASVSSALCRGADEAPPAPCADGFTPLFNGQNLNGWHKLVPTTGGNDDPDDLVQVHGGVIHLYKDAVSDSRVLAAGLSTEADYANYDLRLQYRWGEKRFQPQLDAPPAGVLSHGYGEDGICGALPRGIACQIQPGHAGDVVAIDVHASSTIDPRSPAGLPCYQPPSAGGVPARVGSASHVGFLSRSEGNESEGSESAGSEIDGWNTLEVQVRGDSAAWLVDGKVVNRVNSLERLSPGDPTKWIPLTKGRIVIQAGPAEVLYRHIAIRPVPAEPSAVKPAPGLRVGAAQASFAADDSMALGGGIVPQYVIGQEGELRAVATVLELAGSGKFAVVGCDVLFVTRAMIDRVAGVIEQRCGIPPAHLLVNASHTHHAPSTVDIHGTQASPAFVQNVEDGIVKAVVDANARLSDDCQFLFHLGSEPDIGQNSRLLLTDNAIYWVGPRTDVVRPTGPVDPQLPVFVFRGADDRLLSVIFNHSTHTVGSLRPDVRSPAFYGLAAQALERRWDAPVCFLEGASGSTHRLLASVPDAIDKLERDVTQGVVAAVPRKLSRIVALKRPFAFKVRMFDEEAEDHKVIDYCTKHSPGSLPACTNVFRQSRLVLKPQQGQERQTWLQVMVLGNVALVGVPAEFFTGLGLEIKRRSPLKETYIAELANDWIGYLPDREAHRLGGYQTWVGLHSYAEVGTGERVVDEVVSMLQEIAGQ